ncbi:MAG: hypothetical protein AAFN40_23650 [Cyanobacteria bacterium J06560_6]
MSRVKRLGSATGQISQVISLVNEVSLKGLQSGQLASAFLKLMTD